MKTLSALTGISHFRAELSAELSSILQFWIDNMVDREQGGFYGQLDNNNIPYPEAPRGIVLNSRLLWTFSAAYLYDKKESYRGMADRAYGYIVDHFVDRRNGGVYWSVDSRGNMLDGKKQVYGLAFCIYGLAEYYKATADETALHLAVDIFDHIEKYSLDKKYGGYIEAFTQAWQPIDDLRLSEKDENEKKTMNTHLHIIEAYSNLYTARPSAPLKNAIKKLLDIFDKYFIDNYSSHLKLFMDEQWYSRSSLLSFGHDIEASWLLLQSAETIYDPGYISRFEDLSVKIADAASEGLDVDGGLWYEYDPANEWLVKEKHSWPQAEAMLGFWNAYQLTGEEKYFCYSVNAWEFIKKYLKDKSGGEWFWGVHENYSIMQKEKAGFWKCPYHNTRACLELIRRIGKQADR